MTKLVVGALALAMSVPGVAWAQGDFNDIDQSVHSDAEQDDAIENDVRLDTGRGAYDTAIAAASCQNMILADAWVIVVAASEGLGVISDEDEFTASDRHENGGIGTEFLVDAESAQADCTQSTGPVELVVQTADGFGSAAPNGGVADVMKAVRFSLDLGDRNTIDQDVDAGSADADQAVMNQYDAHLDLQHGAASSSNCQSLVGAHIGVIVASMAHGSAEIEDSDTIEFSVDDTDADASRVGFERSLELDNDHNATSSCSQPMSDVDIWVGHDGVQPLPVES